MSGIAIKLVLGAGKVPEYNLKNQTELTQKYINLLIHVSWRADFLPLLCTLMS